jgi:hypothetical protein
MATLEMRRERRVENQSEEIGHDLIPSENACPA